MFKSNFKSKIVNIDQLLKLRQDWANMNEMVVFTNGCFDILHRGHVDYLNKAAELGTKLIVAINSDKSVTSIKNPNRPIQDEQSRSEIMASMGCVDAVIIFNETTPLELIKALNPNILVKGADYKPKDIVGYDSVTSYGGKVITLDFLTGYSTSLIEKKIKGY
jgi:rfaE bifunctional protein nucleotidyltransferase chain/domain